MSPISRCIQFFRGRTHVQRHLLRVELSASALQHNCTVWQRVIGARHLGMVVKSNAYGHGLREIGRLAETIPEVHTLIVDSIVEARLLRRTGVSKPVLILGYVPQARWSELARMRRVTVVLTSLDQIRTFARVITFPASVQIKVDTGMHRQGVAFAELMESISLLQRNAAIQITGLATHFADADGEDATYTQQQIDVWGQAIALYRSQVGEGCFHMAATAGTQFLDRGESQLVRVGIGCYGIDSVSGRMLGLRPVLAMRGRIVGVKSVSAGESVGYNRTYLAVTDRRLALVPAGYNEGVPRALSNCGSMVVQGVRCPIVGRVSMNMTVIDISEVQHPVQLEQEVEIISPDPQAEHNVLGIARLAQQIPYEILTSISPGLRRWVVE